MFNCVYTKWEVRRDEGNIYTNRLQVYGFGGRKMQKNLDSRFKTAYNPTLIQVMGDISPIIEAICAMLQANIARNVARQVVIIKMNCKIRYEIGVNDGG